MNLLKISFLLLCAGNVLSSPRTTPKPWQYNTRKMNSLSDEAQHCFCFPDGNLPVVHKLLDSNNKGQERLVIYLYKSVDSNEIKMYTPSLEKQILIPDMPYDSNDGLVTLTNENVNTLFYNNPYKIKVYNDRLETINPTVISSLPIGLHRGEIEQIFPSSNFDTSLNDKDISNDYDYNDYVVPQYNDYEDTNFPQPEAPSVVPLSFNSNSSPQKLGAKQNWVLPNTNLESFEETSAFFNSNNLQGALAESHAFPVLPDDKLRSKFMYSFQNAGNLVPSQVGTFDTWFKQQMKRYQNHHFPGDLKTIDSNLLKVLVIKILSENKIYISTNGVITGPNGEIIDTANLELRPLLLGEKINLQIFNKNHKQISLLKRLPFLEGILVTLVSPPQILGIIPLGKIYLTKNSNYMNQILGHLSPVNSSKFYTNKYTDATVYLNPSQLTLNDILSDTGRVKVESISSLSSDGSNTGNLETRVQAQAIPLSDKETQSISAHPYWNSGQYYSAPNVPYPNWNPLGQRRKLNAKIEHIIEPHPSKTTKKVNNVSSTQKEMKDTKIILTTTVEPPVNMNSSEPARRFSGPLLKGMLKTLMFLLNNAPSRREFQSDHNTTQNFDIISDSELTKYDEDGTDFRIIGGSAATGSGTPVSSKGRSGDNEEFSS